MDGLSINSTRDKIIIEIDKKVFDPRFINNLLKGLRFEELVARGNFSKQIVDLSEEIKQNWWKKNKKKYLRGIDAKSSN
ncbi:MAG: hypothetical protein NTX22_08280 [Ignavibacteriales bacterium]|nr:hypothetical protein [Ignavibacteriales bacterium]